MNYLVTLLRPSFSAQMQRSGGSSRQVRPSTASIARTATHSTSAAVTLSCPALVARSIAKSISLSPYSCSAFVCAAIASVSMGRDKGEFL